jgi:hypothetical protein
MSVVVVRWASILLIGVMSLHSPKGEEGAADARMAVDNERCK